MNETLTGWRPQAVVFDCDGLLVDTEPCWTIAERRIFASRGLPFGPAQKALVIGRSLPDAGAAMATAFGEHGTGPALADELLRLVTEVIAGQAEAMAGARELVELVGKAVPVAVASNSPRALLDVALRRGGLAEALRLRVAADEVPAPKPAPDMYLAACDMLGVRPDAVLAFEDSLTGLRSAQAAGVRVVGVPTLRDEPFPADVVVDSLEDPRLLDWIRGWL